MRASESVPDLNDLLGTVADEAVDVDSACDVLKPLLTGRPIARLKAQLPSVVVGELIAIVGADRTPLVCYPGQSRKAALRARTVVDLQDRHIGRSVVLVFENGDPSLAIVMGLVLGDDTWPLAAAPAHVEVDADGQRLQIHAKHQLVLSCGKASITLTEAGKVLIQGSYVLSQSTGANRIRGGSVDIN